MRTAWSERHRGLVWSTAALLGPVLSGLLSLGRPTLHDDHVTLLLVLAVTAVSVSGVRAAGLLAAVTTGLAYDYFWTAPYYSLRIVDGDDIVTVLLLVAVAATTGQLSWWAGRQQASARLRAEHLAGLRLAVDPAGAAPAAGTLDEVCTAITRALEADQCRVQAGGPPSGTVLHTDGTLTRDGVRWDADRLGLPTDDLISLPLGSSEPAPAYFAVSAATQIARPSAEGRQVAALIARLADPRLAEHLLDDGPRAAR